jgi:hypothetical protein
VLTILRRWDRLKILTKYSNMPVHNISRRMHPLFTATTLFVSYMHARPNQF